MDDKNIENNDFGEAADIATHPRTEFDEYSGYSISPDKSVVRLYLRNSRFLPKLSLHKGILSTGKELNEIKMETLNLEALIARNNNLIRDGRDNSLTSKALDELSRIQIDASKITPTQ